MTYVALYNNLAGRRSEKRNTSLHKRIEKKLSQTVVAFHSSDLISLKATINIILKSPAKTLIIVGGDGSLNRVVNALLTSPNYRAIQLAVMPTGTGNSFAMDLNIFDIDSAITAILGNNLRQSHIGLVVRGQQQRYFINTLGLGFISQVAKLANKLRPLGSLSYVVGTLIQLTRLSYPHLNAMFDQTRWQEGILFIDICNSQYTGGGMKMAPDTRIDNGAFQVIVVKPISPWTLLKTFSKIFKGTHTKELFVHSFRAKEITLTTETAETSLIDGDLSFDTPLSVTMSDKTLMFLSN